MRYLECTVVNLKSANLTIMAEFLDGDDILFHLYGQPFSYNLSSGVIHYDNWHPRVDTRGESPSHRLPKDHIMSPEYYVDLIGAREYQAKMKGQMDDIYPIDDRILCFIVNLASRQVTVDELTKGLEASGVNLPDGLRITKLYTGGWSLFSPEDEMFEPRVYDVEGVVALLEEENT